MITPAHNVPTPDELRARYRRQEFDRYSNDMTERHALIDNILGIDALRPISETELVAWSDVVKASIKARSDSYQLRRDSGETYTVVRTPSNGHQIQGWQPSGAMPVYQTFEPGSGSRQVFDLNLEDFGFMPRYRPGGPGTIR